MNRENNRDNRERMTPGLKVKRGRLVWRLTGLIAVIALGAASAFAQGAEAKKGGGFAFEQTEIWKRQKAQTLSYIEKMPEESLAFKPTPEIRSFSEQMIHLAYWNIGILAPAVGKAHPHEGREKALMGEIKMKAALAKFVGESYDFVISALGTLDEAKLLEKVKVFGSDVSRAAALTFALDHQSHHRGQTVIYLRLKGIAPPEM